MNLTRYLQSQKLDSLQYETVYLEHPVPDIINFDWKSILPAPPPNSSKSTYKELLYVIDRASKRTSLDVELIHKIDQDVDPFFIEMLDQLDLSYPESIVSEIYTIIKPILSNLKGIWNRPRPLQLAKFYGLNLPIIITDTIHTASYPSGHTVYANLVAGIIKILYPNISHKSLDKVVDQTALARIQQGVHYPSDNQASLILSNFLVNKLKPIILKRDYYGKIS